MVFEGLVMQAPQSVESVTALIVAISTAVGTVGALVVTIANKIKLASHDKEIEKAANTAINVGKIATAFGQKTAEQQDEIKTVAEVITSLDPNAKKMLDEKQKDMVYWTERATVAEAQVHKLLSLIPPEAQANNMRNDELPRENIRL